MSGYFLTLSPMVRRDGLLINQLLSTLLRRVVFVISFHFLTISILSQTTNISGVINSYYSITDVILAKDGVRVDNVSGLASGDKVLIIQMKGATINTTNTSAFGDTTSLNNAGNYEIGTVCEVIGDTVFFFHTLLNNYTSTEKVQLVKFGEYYSANVVGTLTASTWNSSTGKGGVLAISVQEDLTLNASLSADEMGYAGGSFLDHGDNCSNSFPANGYYYDGSNTSSFGSGAYKGEGVVTLGSSMSGGRGAPANGGGGGNNHNNGGGGGANL